jgi:hypothetical protein
VVILASPNTLTHSEKDRLVVMMRLVFSVELRDQVKQQRAAVEANGQIAEFVQDDGSHEGESLREATLLASRLLLFEPVHQIDDAEEAHAPIGLDRLNRQRQAEMAFAGAAWEVMIPPTSFCVSV